MNRMVAIEVNEITRRKCVVTVSYPAEMSDRDIENEVHNLGDISELDDVHWEIEDVSLGDCFVRTDLPVTPGRVHITGFRK